MLDMRDLKNYLPQADAALVVLRAELDTDDSEITAAIGAIDQLINVVRQGRHPMSVVVRKIAAPRWAFRPHWDRWCAAMEDLANAAEMRVLCTQKYDYLHVEVMGQGSSRSVRRALVDLAEMIALASDYDIEAMA